MAISLTAFQIGPTDGWSIEPAPRRREWMQNTPHKAANRCLPLVIANQAGWVIRCGQRFSATWSGKNLPDAVKFNFPDGESSATRQIMSIFGSGIVTFSVPWLFRTSEGIGLFVRGATNYFKENIVPLDGLVETEWAPYTFTMNWKIMKPKTQIWFKPEDPICMLVPYPIAMLEEVEPIETLIDNDQELMSQHIAWQQDRRKQQIAMHEGTAPEEAFRLDYVRGSNPDGTFAGSHFSKLKLKPFK